MFSWEKSLIMLAFLFIIITVGVYISSGYFNPPDICLSECSETDTGSDPSLHPYINLNTVDSVTLQTIKGVGPVLAENIISYRSETGGFRDINELLFVNGIGESKLKIISEYAYVPG